MQFQKMLVIDLEATCFQPNDLDKPEGWTVEKNQEVIELGCVIVDLENRQRCRKESLELGQPDYPAEISILIKPEGPIGKFCTELTTLRPENFEQAPSLAAAFEVLRLFCKEWKFDIGSMPWGSWGDYDRTQIWRECARKGVQYPFGRCHYNIKGLYSMLTGQKKGFGMDKALAQLGMDLEGTHHRGIDDARNTAKILLHCLKKADS